MLPRGLHTEARIVAAAMVTATIIGAVGTAAYVWGPLHQTYEEICRLYPPLKTLGPAPLGILATLLLTSSVAALITVVRELLVARRLVRRLQAHRTALPCQARPLIRAAQGCKGKSLQLPMTILMRSASGCSARGFTLAPGWHTGWTKVSCGRYWRTSAATFSTVTHCDSWWLGWPSVRSCFCL